MRRDMGIPEQWHIVDDWLDDNIIPTVQPEPVPSMPDLKYKNIPVLQDYSRAPDESFWANFPKRDLPPRPETRINADALEKKVMDLKSELSFAEQRRASKVIKDLREGADAYQMKKLPPLTTPNSKSALEYGALITDKIAGWIEAGFVAGPFESCPCPGFRANPLIAIVRNGKVRPCLNMSGPKGRSFNDNVDMSKLERVHMDTAKKFGYKLRELGKEAVFSKFDYGDAYKSIPAATEDLPLQGFIWLGRFFVETQEIFGAIPSVCNFDREGNTFQVLVIKDSGVRRDAVFRILDDTSHICKKGSQDGQRFVNSMRNLCESVNMPLAPLCPNNEKAFELQTRGTVMGVGFDSSSMSWYFSQSKAEKVARRCLHLHNCAHSSLKEMEKVMGSVNDMSQMMPFARFYKTSGNAFLASFKSNYDIMKLVPSEVKADMLVLAKIALESEKELPIPVEQGYFPLSALHFYTDAAGAAFSIVKGERKVAREIERGVACIGGTNEDDIWFWAKVRWPFEFIAEARDEYGKFFGSKSTTLESIGLLLPFLAVPELVTGKYLIFHVDNIAVVHGWQKGRIKNDAAANSIIKIVNVIAAYCGTRIAVKHVPRNSTELAELADELSRSDRLAVKIPGRRLAYSPALCDWFREPSSSNQLLSRLLREIKTRI